MVAYEARQGAVATAWLNFVSLSVLPSGAVVPRGAARSGLSASTSTEHVTPAVAAASSTRRVHSTASLSNSGTTTTVCSVVSRAVMGTISRWVSCSKLRSASVSMPPMAALR